MKFVFRDEHYINTIEKLEALDAILMDGETPRFQLMAFDTETNGLLFHKHVVIGFSISTSADVGYYVPLLEWTPNRTTEKQVTIKKKKYMVFKEGHLTDVWTGKTYPENVTPQQYSPPDFIKMFAARWLGPLVKLLMHNAPFDCNMFLYHFGIDLAPNLFADTILLKHVIDENTRHGLKETASAWKHLLGFSPDDDAKKEQLELGESVIRNGGTFNMKTKHVWRGDGWFVAKYGAADTCLTFGVFGAGMKKMETEYTPQHLEWFFNEEVMPVCREVVIPMRYGGVFTQVSHFEKLKGETQKYMDLLEDQIQKELEPLVPDFSIGLSLEEAVSQKRFVERIIELEQLDYPTQTQKGVTKRSLAKKAVEGAYNGNPHWLWGFILGTEEIKYSEARIREIKAGLYQEVLERRYRFNIRSSDHLRWLFCKKLRHDPRKLPQTKSATPTNPIPSMKAEVLEEFFMQYPFVKQLLLFKRLDKLMGSYILPALELNNNGWLHMDMKQHGTVSGRFACSGGFNLQTLPKVENLEKCPKCESKKVQIEQVIDLVANSKCQDCGHLQEGIICPSAIKAGFVAPPGYKIINADYQALEPRCFAYMSGDPKLKQVYKDGLDIYSKVYIDMMDKDGKYSAHPDAPNFLKKINPDARDLFKPVLLSIPYGSRAPQVANLMNLKIRKKMKNRETGEMEMVEMLDVEQGKYFRDLLLSTYTDLHNYMERMEMQAVSQGFVETKFGRRRHFQYAPFVFRLISGFGVSTEEFLDAKNKDLKFEHAMNGRLRQEGLYKFCSQYGMRYSELMEKECWLYIRNLFKNELNNSKNVPIQGLGGHITNKAMLNAARSFKSRNIDGYLFLQVHDEISSYAIEKSAQDASDLLKIAMEKNEFALQLDVAMEAKPVICTNLKDSK